MSRLACVALLTTVLAGTASAGPKPTPKEVRAELIAAITKRDMAAVAKRVTSPLRLRRVRFDGEKCAKFSGDDVEVRITDVPAFVNCMADLGIDDPALHLLTSRCVDALGLQSFFTVGEDEVRQWFVRRGALAPEAAGAIHSDLQRGFIRAEVMKYDDLMAAGSEDKLKATGKYYLKGKDYTVEDGDILTIRFNV